jgi:hypothetical protein
VHLLFEVKGIVATFQNQLETAVCLTMAHQFDYVGVVEVFVDLGLRSG